MNLTLVTSEFFFDVQTIPYRIVNAWSHDRRKLTVSEFKKQIYVGVREYYLSGEELKPGKKVRTTLGCADALMKDIFFLLKL
jgi:hypothetical protein